MAGKAELQEYSGGCLYRLMHFYGDNGVNESELYKELGTLTKDRERWETSIPYVSSLLTHDSVKIQAKVLWLLGEMGLTYPQSVQDVVPDIASFYNSPVPLLRERAVNALGRIGRADYRLIEPFWQRISPQIHLKYMRTICPSSPDYWTMQMTKSGWKRRRSSGFWVSAGRSLSDRIWNSCSGWLKQTKTAS